jgi:hypothetical protein
MRNADVVGWSISGGSGLVLVCSRCMEADPEHDADLHGAAEWAVSERRAPALAAAAGEVLIGQPEATEPCVRCGQPLASDP